MAGKMAANRQEAARKVTPSLIENLKKTPVAASELKWSCADGVGGSSAIPSRSASLA